MKLFKIFKSPANSASLKDGNVGAQFPISQTEENQVSVFPSAPMPESVATSSTSSEPRQEDLITITYGTGMPIDVIYAYIGKDYEADGYQDALVNSSVEYCKSKENIIINRLLQLFGQVSLTYRGEIRKLNVQIENSRALFNLTSASMLEARRATCEEHIAEINKLLEKLKVNAPEMMTMIDSYRRGFSKGLSAQTATFISRPK